MVGMSGRWQQLEAYHRQVLLLSGARLISMTGSIAAYVALVAVVYNRSDHSGTWVAAVLVVAFAVSAGLAPDGGTWAGFRFAWSLPALRLTLLATSVGLLGTGMINVAEYPLFVDMGGGSRAYGIAVAGWALGGFVAGRVIRRQGDSLSERRRPMFGCALVAVAIGLCGVVPVVGAVVVLFSIGGFAANTRSIAATLIYQRWTPDHIRARTFSALGSANIGAIGIAMIVSGTFLNTLTPAGVCIACGLIGLLALLIASRVPPRRPQRRRHRHRRHRHDEAARLDTRRRLAASRAPLAGPKIAKVASARCGDQARAAWAYTYSRVYPLTEIRWWLA